MISYNKIAPSDRIAGIKSLLTPFTIKNIYSAHNYCWNKKMYFSGESHKYHEVVFVMDGEVTISEDDRIYYLSKGDLIVHAPYEFHRIATDKGAQILLFSFDTDEAFPDKLYDGFFVLSEEEKIEFCRLFDKIYTFYHFDDTDDIALLSKEIATIMPAFFFSVASTNKSQHYGIRSRCEEEYKKIVETMHEHINENLSLEELATINHSSVSYIKYLFHRYAGVGAKSYYATLRLNEVIRLLECGTAVADVARALNFSSPEYLSLFFKKHTGVPPGQWKKRNESL